MSRAPDSFDIQKVMRFENRSTDATVATILNLSRSGIKKTDIMYRANLSYSLLKKYVEFLKEQGLIEERDSSNASDEKSSAMIYTTRKGRDFLEKYKALADIAGDVFSPEPWGNDGDSLKAQEDRVKF